MQEYWWSFEEVQHSQGRKGAETMSEDLRRSALESAYESFPDPLVDRRHRTGGGGLAAPGRSDLLLAGARHRIGLDRLASPLPRGLSK